MGSIYPTFQPFFVGSKTERRKQMKKENVNVVIKNKSHSRESLSGIYNACGCKIKENASMNKYVEDPRQHSSGMIPNLMGFTLIELLVVVLIIGILAAVALPQYQKAVNKTRLTQVISNINVIQKAVDVYLLNYGFGEDYTFLLPADDEVMKGPLDIGLDSLCQETRFGYCVYNGVQYQVTIEEMDGEMVAFITVQNAISDSPHWGLQLYSIKKSSTQTWENTCYWGEGMPSEYLCQTLFAQGWKDGGEW